jgi:hypothetical protein
LGSTSVVFLPVKYCKKEKFKKIGFESFGERNIHKISDFEGFGLLEVKK